MATKIFRVLLLAALAFSALMPVTVARAGGPGCSWNGSVNAKWSTPGNWDAGCSGTGGIPGSGDTLTFPTGASNTTMSDDLSSITLQGLVFTSSLSYSINGSNTISLIGGIDVQSGAQTINNPLAILNDGVVFQVATASSLTLIDTLNLGTYNLWTTVNTATDVTGLQILGVVHGSGAAKISKNGTGDLQFGGDDSGSRFDINLISGSISTISSGGTWLPYASKITLEPGTDLNLQSGGAIGAIEGSGNIHASSFFQIRQYQNTTFTGDIFGASQLAVVGDGTSKLTIDRSGGSLSYIGELNVNAGGILKVVNTTTTASVPGFLVAQGRLELNNSHVGPIQLGYSGGGFNYNGALVLSGTTVSTASQITMMNNSSIASVINSATDYGRITVTSPVDLGSGTPVFLLQGSYVPTNGETYAIIQNTNAGTATKTNAAFSGLPQGGTLPFNSLAMAADYLAAGNTTFALVAVIDVIPPTVKSITRASADPTNFDSVDFTVTFSEPVTGVDLSDFELATNGVSGVTLSGFSGTGDTYTVTASTGTGDGTIGINVPIGATIADLASNPIDSLPFTGGEVYTIVKTAPVLASPANGATLHYNRPTFDWMDFPGVTGYQIQVSKSSAFTSSAVVVNVTLNSASNTQYLPIKDLARNTLMYWRVRGKISSNKYTPWSQVWTLTTANPPSVPALVAPSNGALVSGPPVFFDWKDSTVPSGAIFDHYQIQFSTNNFFTANVYVTDVAGITNSQDSFSVLNPGTTCYWRVRSYALNGDYSAWSTVRNVKVKYTAPVLSLPANGATGVSLLPAFTWNTTVGATNYTIQVSKSANFSSKVINKTVTLPAYTATTNLVSGTTYYWRVKVNGLYGPSDWSLVFSFIVQ